MIELDRCPACGCDVGCGPTSCPACHPGTTQVEGTVGSTPRTPEPEGPGTRTAIGDAARLSEVSTDPIGEVPGRASAPDPYATDPNVSAGVVDPYATLNPDAFRPPAAALPTVPGYEVLGELGRGGMGVVYQARQLGLNRLVALKMILSGKHAGRKEIDRFRTEAEVIARLDHPHVVRIFQVDQADGGGPCLSLELLAGGSLADRLAGAPQPARQAAELLSVLAGAVHAAHRAGVVHRDLKPQNVLFDAAGTPKVTDFGLAKLLEGEDGFSRTGQPVGTPPYMAPEQADGHHRAVGPATDIYALGVILYEMLTGRPPHRGTTPMETLYLVATVEPVPPSRLQPKLPRDLETICLKCLVKEPSRRYASAEALADDLKRFLDDRPIQARRTPAWERARKWARRHPTAASLAGLGLAATITAAVAGARYNDYRQMSRAIEARRVDAIRLRSLNLLAQARAQLRQREFEDARVKLTEVLATTAKEPLLKALYADADAIRRDIEDREADRDRFVRFGKLKDAALLRDAQAIWRGDEARPAEARAALAEFRAEDGVPRVPTTLSGAERAEALDGCYELILVLAGAVARPGPGEDPKRQGAEALRLLDRARQWRPPTAAYHLRRAACLDSSGDADSARRERDQADGPPPTDAFDLLLLGQERCRGGELEKALRHFEAALRLRPDLFWAECLSAVCLLNATPSRPAEAKAMLTACLNRHPEYPWLYLLRGLADTQLGALAQAAAARFAARAEALHAEAEVRFKAAEEDFRRALDEHPEAGLRYALLMGRGVLRFQRRRWDEAAVEFQAAIALDGSRYNAHASLAEVDLRRDRRADAIRELSRAIDLRPHRVELRRARALAILGESSEPLRAQAEAAVLDLTEAVRDEAGTRAAADDQVRLGHLLLRLGRPAEAIEACEAALRVAPTLDEALVVKVAALMKLDRTDEAVAACDSAQQSRPLSAKLHELRGLGRVKQGKYGGAIEDYTASLAMLPQAPTPEGGQQARERLHRYRGWSYLLSGQAELAEKDFQESLGLDDSDAEAYGGLGAARVQLGRPREAVEAAEKGLKQREPTSQDCYVAARTYAQAATLMTLDDGPGRRPSPPTVRAYEAASLRLLGRALERHPAETRRAFWNDVVSADEAFRRLRLHPRFAQLARAANP